MSSLAWMSLSFALLLGPLASVRAGPAAVTVPLALEYLEFDARTSLQAISIHGKANGLEAKAGLQGDRLVSIEAAVTPENIVTGIALRDQHMRRKIFEASDGSLPAIRFAAEGIACSGGDCPIGGELRIRGLVRPAVFRCRLTGAIGECEAVIRLSDYGIEPPSQLGIRVSDEVMVRVRLRRS